MSDLDALLAPVSTDHPSGEDLSFSLEYDAIQEARRADDPSLAQGEWVTELKTADWAAVSRQCTGLLSERSKDLRLAGWWAEAATRLYGLPGLADGYRLVAGLCERYWEDVHPQVEDGDLEQRIGNLGWLISHSGDWLRALPLTQAPQGRFGIADFENARARRDDDSDAPTPDVLEAARRDTPREFYLQLVEQVPDCRQALAALEHVVDTRLGLDGPSFAALRDQLTHLGDTIGRFAREAGVLVDEPAADAPTTGEAPVTSTPASATAPATAGELTTRREAIAQLRRVADFFRRTEPHSPVAYLAEKAASWGEMPLHIWLRRVVRDDATLSQLEEMLDVAETGNDG